MSNEKTVMIHGVEYVEKSSVTPGTIGSMRIIIGDRGWIFVGSCTDNEDGTVTINNAKNIRKWGTSKGLGELVNGPLDNTKYDEYGVVKLRPLAEINVHGGW